MQKKHYLSACCIVKDEDPFIMEWLTYHSLIGIEHFYIYDNESANPLYENPLIRKFSEQGKVTVISAAGRAMQIPSYTHCLKKFGPRTRWLAFIDLDEFICPLEGRDLRPFLAAYEDYAALGLSWKSFSSGGHLSSPHGLVIENYQERFLKEGTRNLHIKSILQPHKNHAVHTPHSFWPNEGEVAISAVFRPITRGTPVIPICWERAVVNHYVLKSQEDSQRRIRRGRADILSDKPTVDDNDFYHMVREPAEPDSSIVRFAPEVKSWMLAQELPEEHADALAGATPENLIALGEKLLLQGKFMESGIALCHAALTQSENLRLWQARTLLAAKTGHDDLSRLFAEKSARIKAGLSSSPYPLLLAEQDAPEQLLKITLKNVTAMLNDGRLDEAESALTALDGQYRLPSQAWVLRGQIARMKRDYPLAEQYLHTALGLEENLEAYQGLLQLHLEQGRLHEAREMVVYLLYTGTYRAADPDFYIPFEKMLQDLRRLTGD